MNKLIVSLSPHIHGNDSVERNMYGVIIALLPALLVSFFYFGIGSVIVCATSVLACIATEYIIQRYLLKRGNTITDGSAIITGLLLGFNLPSNLPVWIIIIGAVVAIGIGKMTFGGLGNNPFNPALVGRCFLLVSFPAQMTSWPIVGQLGKYTDATTSATPLYYMKEAIKTGDASLLNNVPDSLHLLLGQQSQCRCWIHRRDLCPCHAFGFCIYARKKNHHMAHTSEHHRNSFRIQCHLPCPQPCIRIATECHSQRRSHAWSHLHGNGLHHIADDTQGATDIRRWNRIADGYHQKLGFIPRRYVVRNSNNECLYTSY